MFGLVRGTAVRGGVQLAPDPFVTPDHLMNMHLKRIPELKLCPSCGRHMTRLSASEIYECKGCRLFVTEAR
jgi:tRNA(Ile2) C34 agmatinyltransferase TiaS